MAKLESKWAQSNGAADRAETSDEVIGRTFRKLAAEHVELRAKSGAGRAALAEGIWQRVQATEAERDVPRLGKWIGAGGMRRPSGMMWAAAACAAVALSGGLWAWSELPGHVGGAQSGLSGVHPTDGRLHFEVDGAAVGPDEQGRGHLIASEGAPVGVRLSDKSQINLQPHTTLRLSALSDGVVIARISQGVLDVEVVHQEHTNYQFFAGPFLVKVVGTAFRLGYDPDRSSVDLRMRSGVVEVLGPDGASRTVRGGEALHLDASSEDSDGSAELEAERTTLEAEAMVLEDVPTEGPSTVNKADGSGRGRSSSNGVDFHALAAQGSFAKIVDIANAQGIDSLLAAAPADQLQELAQAARYTGHLALAERVAAHVHAFFWQSVGPQCHLLLGRLDEQRGRHGAALGRYESYLRSSPKGVYVQEAWGRKLQLSQKTQGAAAAAQVAQQYLQKFPRGPYAATAKSILSRSVNQ